MTDNKRNKCENCGKFVADEDFYVYTHYGSYGETEPPLPTYSCKKCLPNPEYVWIKPRKVSENM